MTKNLSAAVAAASFHCVLLRCLESLRTAYHSLSIVLPGTAGFVLPARIFISVLPTSALKYPLRGEVLASLEALYCRHGLLT